MHVALYRKYRSATFGDVCGQDHITSTLRYQAKSGRVSHAYLFCGSRGTGKTSCAKILAKAVNCEDPRDGEPCGVCESCRSIDRGNATDVVEMDAASETGVEYIRSIKEEVQYPPALLKKRVYIIDEVHMLSDSAFNALLKTLEEPPEHVIFILATTELYKLPATVVSRCQRFDFRRLPIDVITSRLSYIADKEQIKLEPSASELIAKQAQGGMRDAISLLDLCSGGGADVTEDRVRTILGISGYERVAKSAISIAERDVAALFDDVANVVSSSKDISVYWRELSSFYRDMLVAKYAKDPKSYLDLTQTDFELLTNAASKFTLPKLYYHSKILDAAQKDMSRMPEIKRMTAEFALVRMCDEALDTTPEALTARIDALESAVAALSAGNIPAFERKAEPAVPDSESRAEPPVNPTVSEIKTSEATAPDFSEESKENDAHPPAPAPGTRAAQELKYRRVPDISEVAQVIGKQDFMARALLAEASAELSEDGSEIRLVTSNSFLETYFSEDLLKAVSDAFITCRINDRAANVSVVVKNSGDAPPYSELFENL